MNRILSDITKYFISQQVAGNPGSPALQNPALRDSLALQPFGKNKSLPYFITVYLYKKTVNLSWVLGG